jgi:hypothetical protein
LFPRHPRFVDFIKKALSETAAAIVEELLVQGRAQTVDVIVSTADQLQQQHRSNADDADEEKEKTSSENPEDEQPLAVRSSSLGGNKSDRDKYLQSVLESFLRLVRGGFIERVPEIIDATPAIDIDDDDEGENTFEDGPAPPAKKVKLENYGEGRAGQQEDDNEEGGGDDPAVVELLKTGPYKMIPQKAVWRVNIEMFHQQIRAIGLGWLVADRYGQKLQNVGSIVTAALKLEVARTHAAKHSSKPMTYEDIYNFTAEDVKRYLPKAVVENFEKKEGGVIPKLHHALKELSLLRNPVVVEEVEVAPDQPDKAKFQVQTRRLVTYLQDRIIHQVCSVMLLGELLTFFSFLTHFIFFFRLSLIVTAKSQLVFVPS